MSTKKDFNSSENFTSSPSEDARSMSLRARRGIRSKRIREMMPYIEELNLEESPSDSSPSIENNESSELSESKTAPNAKETPQEIAIAPAKKRGRPPRQAKIENITESQEQKPTEQVAPAKKRGRPKKTQPSENSKKTAANSTNIQEETLSPKQEKTPKKSSKTTSKKEKIKARTQEKKSKQAEKSEQEEILSTLKEAPLPEQSIEQTQPHKDVLSTSVKQGSEPSEIVASFKDLSLSPDIIRAIEELGYTTPTPIQARAIPEILSGRDVLGVAQTGTGKTASFILPLLEKLSTSRARARMPRTLILEPTRELALQVAENIQRYSKYLNLTHALLIGGSSMTEQKEILQRGVDILIATPGRLIDIFERGDLLLNQTDLLVIDEADRMLDMGFIPEIEKIVALLPQKRQTLFFSATMAPTIKKLADDFLNCPQEITIAPESSINNNIHEFVFFIKKEDKHRAIKRLLHTELIQNAIIFCNRKRDVDLLFNYLSKNRFSVGHLHGDLDQNIRFETLERFRAEELHVLVCSDVAARGIDISGLSHVFNYDLPFNAEDYVHRIGRTGRAGNIGYAFNFVAPEEVTLLEAIEQLTKKPIEQAVIEGFETFLPESHIIQPHMEQAFLHQEKQETSPEKTDTLSSGTKNHAENDISHHALSSTEEKNISIETYQEFGQALPLDKNGFLPAISEKDSIQKGFGDYTPSFMEVSFPPRARSFPVA